MNAIHVTYVLFLAGTLVTAPATLAEDTPRHTLPDDPQQAWLEVQKVHQALRPPAAWRNTAPNAEQVAAFQAVVRQDALAFAAKAREFAERFPTNENVADARITVVHALSHAVAAGDTAAEQQSAAYTASVLADETIPEDDRAGVLLYSGNAVFMKKVGMRLFTEGMSKLRDDFELASLENARAALKQFPSNSLIYTMFVSIAQRSEGARQKQLATEVLEAPDAPPGAKTLASHILKGTKPYQVGRPLDIRFRALDGREVDLAKMTNQVVLVDFWSTTCGPCIAETPALKVAYEKLHPRGFEIVAISLDDKEPALRRYIQEQKLPWPQHFDGKGWANEFALRYGIFSIPTMWLVDKQGRLRVTQARGDLERRVTALLDEPGAAAK